MTRTAAQLADAIAAHADGLPLAEPDLLAQAATLDASRWRGRWPGGLPVPATLADVPVPDPDAAPGESPKVLREVTRGEVLERGRVLDAEEDVLDLYVLAFGWGAGAQGLSVTRSLKPLRDDGTTDRLLRAAELVRAGDVARAYESMWSGENAIKRLGPSSFTLWLYAAGHAVHADEGPGPLVLDHRTAAALGWSGARVSATAYGRYLELAAEAAELLAERLGREVTPHAVEHALTTIGG